MNKRIPTSIWTNEKFARLSPEQKTICLYLHTNSYVSPPGKITRQFKMMSFELGMSEESFRSALKGLSIALPDFVSIDHKTGDVLLSQCFEK